MIKEKSKVVYRMSKEDVVKAIEDFLQANNQNVKVEKVEPEFEREYYSIGMFEEDYREIFDGLKIVATEQG